MNWQEVEWQNKIKFHSIQERTNGMAGHKTSEDKLSQEDGT